MYAIVFKETNEILTPKSFKKFWPNYGSAQGHLYGWRPAKKFYEKIGQAKSGFAHIPDQLKPLLKIVKLGVVEDVIDGEELKEKQDISRKKKVIAQEKRRSEWKLENAKKELARAQKNLKELEGKEFYEELCRRLP